MYTVSLSGLEKILDGLLCQNFSIVYSEHTECFGIGKENNEFSTNSV